jgi:predicted ribosomally synthesized peptide with SipW-like signal peptide
MKYKIFAASAMIAVLVALASGGTTLAALNDSEESEENLFHVGAVDFRIGWNLSRNGESKEDQVPIDNPYRLFDERNITPGDHGEATIGLYNRDNPAYMQFKAKQTGNSENDIIDTETKNEIRQCSRVMGYQKGDSFKADRLSAGQASYTVSEKRGSYIGLEAPEGNRIGEKNSEETDEFVFELDGKPEPINLEVESGGETAFLTLGQGESRELFSGALEVEVVDIERVSKDEYRVERRAKEGVQSA